MVKYHNFSFQTKPESESYRQPEDEPFLPSEYSQHKTRNAWHTYFAAFHVILTTVLAFVCLGLLMEHHSSKLGTYETGFNTELTAILPSIELETRTFHFVTSAEEGSHREYVGSRTPDIDHAWNRLLHSANLDLTDEEAGVKVWNTTWKWEDTGLWFSGVSMWHQLHCVNILREAVHWDTYNGPPDSGTQYHLDHCLNYLRQVIMCYADLTPMRYDWDQGAGRLMLQDEPHTCRNYKKIDEWARPRASCHVPAPHQPETVKAPPRGSCVRGPYFADE